MSETLEQYADRIVSVVRKRLLDHLDDDVIGHLSKSHLVFARACVSEAISNAMTEARSQPPLPGDVEAMREACAKVADSWCAADYSEECNIMADSIAREIRALPLPKAMQEEAEPVAEIREFGDVAFYAQKPPPVGTKLYAHPATRPEPVGEECPLSPDGRHQVDTSMESGPNNCFHCEQPMERAALS